MAFKLTKKQLAERDEKLAELDEAKEALEKAISEANTAVNAAVDTYNEKLSAVRDFAEEIAGDARSEYDDKSERWQEGDKGQEADSWISEWENVELDDIEVAEIEEPTLDHSETVRGLPEEP